MSTFAIGEVAIYNSPLALLHGAEVTIISELRHGGVYSNHSGLYRQEPYYLVDSPQFTAEERAAKPCAAAVATAQTPPTPGLAPAVQVR